MISDQYQTNNMCVKTFENPHVQIAIFAWKSIEIPISICLHIGIIWYGHLPNRSLLHRLASFISLTTVLLNLISDITFLTFLTTHLNMTFVCNMMTFCTLINHLHIALAMSQFVYLQYLYICVCKRVYFFNEDFFAKFFPILNAFLSCYISLIFFFDSEGFSHTEPWCYDDIETFNIT